MKEGTEFEKLTEEIFQHIKELSEFDSVEHNVMLPGPEGDRQIDVLLKGTVGENSISVIIECKDHNKNLSITTVDALHSKMMDVGATQSILVSRKGFSSGAKKKAKRLGIVLCTAHEAKSEKWPFVRKLPFIIEEHYCGDMRFAVQADTPPDSPLDLSYFNNYYCLDFVTSYWNENAIPLIGPETWHQFTPKIHSSLTSKSKNGNPVKVTAVRIGLKVERRYYFGYLDELESAKGLANSDTQHCDVVFESNEFTNYRDRFPEYTNIADIPNVPQVMHITIKVLRFQQIDLEKRAAKEEKFTSIKLGENGPTYRSGPRFQTAIRPNPPPTQSTRSSPNHRKQEIICRLTGIKGVGVKSHIIPTSFYRLPKNLKKAELVPLHNDERAIRSMSGIYDTETVTTEGQKLFQDWNTYAHELLIKRKGKGKPVLQEGKVLGIEIEQYKYDQLKLFFISLLWRASVSKHEFFSNVNLDTNYEKELKHRILEKSPGNLDDFTILIGYYEDLMQSGLPIVSPWQSQIDKICYYTFFLGFWAVLIKVDPKPCDNDHRFFALSPSRPLRLQNFGLFQESKVFIDFLLPIIKRRYDHEKKRNERS